MHFCAAALLHQPPCPGALTMGLTGNREKRRHPFLTFCKNDSAGKPCNSQTISPAADPKTFGTLPLQPARGRMTENAGSHSRKNSEEKPRKAPLPFQRPKNRTSHTPGNLPVTKRPGQRERKEMEPAKQHGTHTFHLNLSLLYII